MKHVARHLIIWEDDFNSQELSNLLWAFGTLGFDVTQKEAAIKITMKNYIFLKSMIWKAIRNSYFLICDVCESAA